MGRQRDCFDAGLLLFGCDCGLACSRGGAAVRPSFASLLARDGCCVRCVVSGVGVGAGCRAQGMLVLLWVGDDDGAAAGRDDDAGGGDECASLSSGWIGGIWISTIAVLLLAGTSFSTGCDAGEDACETLSVNYVRSSLKWGPTTFLDVVATTYGWWPWRRGRFPDGFLTYEEFIVIEVLPRRFHLSVTPDGVPSELLKASDWRPRILLISLSANGCEQLFDRESGDGLIGAFSSAFRCGVLSFFLMGGAGLSLESVHLGDRNSAFHSREPVHILGLSDVFLPIPGPS
ncbi:hypothetical protein C8J57DRAFT_1525099 [Mycena rebaudengoi]|nr:hypothetical protein C8J57DRAFT_1525099 [Mycena rebaudengoi]